MQFPSTLRSNLNSITWPCFEYAVLTSGVDGVSSTARRPASQGSREGIVLGRPASEVGEAEADRQLRSLSSATILRYDEGVNPKRKGDGRNTSYPFKLALSGHSPHGP